MLHHDATSVVVYNVYGTEVYLGHTGIVIRPGGIVIHPGGIVGNMIFVFGMS